MAAVTSAEVNLNLNSPVILQHFKTVQKEVDQFSGQQLYATAQEKIRKIFFVRS